MVMASSSWLEKKIRGMIEMKNAIFTAVFVCKYSNFDLEISSGDKIIIIDKIKQDEVTRRRSMTFT